MASEVEEIAKFGLGIRVSRNVNNQLTVDVQSVNQGVPDEIIITNLKAFTQKLEKSFNDVFESK